MATYLDIRSELNHPESSIRFGICKQRLELCTILLTCLVSETQPCPNPSCLPDVMDCNYLHHSKPQVARASNQGRGRFLLGFMHTTEKRLWTKLDRLSKERETFKPLTPGSGSENSQRAVSSLWTSGDHWSTFGNHLASAANKAS